MSEHPPSDHISRPVLTHGSAVATPEDAVRKPEFRINPDGSVTNEAVMREWLAKRAKLSAPVAREPRYRRTFG